MESFSPRHPGYAQSVAEIFEQAPFVRALGIALGACGPGWLETRLPLRPDHLQQSGVAHAGVVATLADHTAGGASTTLIDAAQAVLSIEFKVNLLRGARGQALFCRAEVLRAGRTVSVAEAEVFSEDEGRRTRVAKATVTLAVVPREPQGGVR